MESRWWRLVRTSVRGDLGETTELKCVKCTQSGTGTVDGERRCGDSASVVEGGVGEDL